MKYYALILSIMCIIFFILQITIPGFTDILILNSLAFQQPWRFISAIFLHGSTLHLFYNLFALILFGLIFEKLIGGKRFLLVFFLSGILANIISVNFYPASLGASGAIYGILGALAVIRPRMIVFVYTLPLPMFLASILWIIGAIYGALVGAGNIGHISHLSGIIVGIIFGLFFKLRHNKKKVRRAEEIIQGFRIPESKIRDWEDRWMV